MSAEVIKEFLVSLGVKIDEAGEKRFIDAIGTMTKGAVALGVALEATAVAAIGVVHRISAGMSSLGYMAERTGTKAGEIKKMQFAFEQLGSTAEQAGAAVEAMAGYLRRTGPGGEAWLKGWGVATRDANGQLKDAKQLVEEFAIASAKQKPFIAEQLAATVGISFDQLRVMRDKHYREFQREFEEKFGKTFADKAIEQAQQFERSWNKAVTSIQVAITNLTNHFSEQFKARVEAFTTWMTSEEGGQQMAKTFEKVATVLLSVLEKVEALARGIIKFLGPETTAWLVVVGLVGKFTGLSVVLTAVIIPAIGRLAAALAGLMTGASGFALRTIGAMFGVAGFTALAGAAGFAAGMMPTPAGKGENERQRQENIAKDPDYYKEGHPGGPVKDERTWWQRVMPKALGGKDAPKTGAVGGISKEMLDLAARGEAGKYPGGGYNTWAGGAQDDLTSKTLDEIDKMQTERLAQGKGSDAGRWQITRTTLRDFKNQLGLKGDEKFDEAMQARLAASILASTKGDPNKIKGRFLSLAQASNDEIAQAWKGSGGGDQTPKAVSDAMAPAGTPAISAGTTVVTSKSGRKFRVASQFAENFRGFIDDYEKAGGKIGPSSGGLSERPNNASYHPLGRAIDINQVGRDVRAGGKTLPVDVENALAEKWGLRSGANFSRPDAGHFEVNSAMAAYKALEAQGKLAKNAVPPEPVPLERRTLKTYVAGDETGKSPPAKMPEWVKNWPSLVGSAKADPLAHLRPSAPVGHPRSIRYGDHASTLNQKTTIQVNAAGDPGATARSIAGVQSQVNADALRNLQSAAH